MITGQRISPNKVALVVLVLFSILSRIVLQLDKVFPNGIGGGPVLFRGVDPWYHMRLVDALVTSHQYIQNDSFSVFGVLTLNKYRPLLDIIAVVLHYITPWIDYQVTSAFIPPIFAGIITLVVYFIGKTYFNSLVGLLAALLVNLMPTEFFQRTLLGFFDHHFLEVLWISLLVLFIPKSLTSRKYAIVTSVVFVLYSLTWIGFSLIIGVISVYVWFRVYKDPAISLENLVIIAIPVSIISSLFYDYLTSSASLMGILGVPLGIKIGNPTKKIFYSGILFTLLVVVIKFNKFLWGSSSSIQEAQPLTVVEFFFIYGICSILFLAGFIYYFKYEKKKEYFLLVWSLGLIALGVGQRRWGYYATIPIGLWSAYFIVRLLDYVPKPNYKVCLSLTSVFIVIIYLSSFIQIANLKNNINLEWYNSLVWLEENTPEPFTNPPTSWEYNHNSISIGNYGVLAWWDYGSWILRISHRIPFATPQAFGSQTGYWYLYNGIDPPADAKYLILNEEFITSKQPGLRDRLDLKEAVNPLNTTATRIWLEEDTNWKLLYTSPQGIIKIFGRTPL